MSKNTYWLLVAVLPLAACAGAPTLGDAQARPRVILIVGDGMGLGQWSAAKMSATAPLAVERLPFIGLVDTRCDCTRTTDSGAAATAFATGRRTEWHFVGVARDSTPLRTVLEAAEERGLATGLVTTTSIADATPAAFAAHVPERAQLMEIAAQMATKNIEVLLGGGRNYFSRRPDGRDLLGELRSQQYTVVQTPDEFNRLDPGQTNRLIGLFANTTIFPNRHLRPTLPEMARTALAILDRDPHGFFVLLESEDTDDINHRQMAIDSVVAGVRELDQTIEVALEYQRRHPNTLIVVIGDHETGGLTLYVERSGSLRPSYATNDHSATMVPVFAGGPGAEQFGRWLTHEDVGRLLFRAIGTTSPVR